MKSLLANITMTMDLMSCKIIRNFFTILVLIIGFLSCGMTLICVNVSDYDTVEYNKKCDISRTGCMANDDVYISEEVEDYGKLPYKQFYNRLKKSGLVEKCAQYSILGNPDVDPEIIRIQEGHQIGEHANMGDVEFIYVQKDIFDIYDVKMELKIPKEDWNEEGVFLGSKFKEKYDDADYIDFKGGKRKILGFIKENQTLPFEEIAYEDGTALTGLYKLDYAFFYLTAEDFYTGYEIHFRLADGVTREEFIDEVHQMAEEEETLIRSLYFIDDHLAELKKGNVEMLGSIVDFAIVILVVIALICISVKVHSIFSNKKLYGILYSSGLSTNQINSLFAIENTIVLFFSLIVAYLCLYHGIYIFCGFFGKQAPHLIIEVVKSILVSKVFLQECLICLAMVIITSVIPMIVFSRLSPLSMMRDFYE